MAARPCLASVAVRVAMTSVAAPGVAHMTSMQRVTEALERRGAKHSGFDWTCPAHDDRNPSLSVRAGQDGKTLLKCQAGCSTEGVVAALGLSMADLFDEAKPALDGRTEAASYDYVDEGGVVLFQVVRFYPKDFRQRRPDGRGGWEWNLNGVRRVLYRLPQVIDQARQGGLVYVVEGEKDVHAVERAGVVGTCNPGGAGKWKPEYARALAGAHVVVAADRDQAGREHAAEVARSLKAEAASVRLVEPAIGKDVADHLASGAALDDLVPMEREREAGAEEIAARVHFPRLVDGAAFALDAPAHPPAVWGRGEEVLWSDGEYLMVFGPEGTGKTTLASWLVLGLLGLVPELLGLPVAPVERVLLIAADRPAQIQRRFGSFVSEDERPLLRERLLVHRGPLEFDIVSTPLELAAWSRRLGVGAIVLDSLGAQVSGLAKDDVGSAVARAFSETVASGIQTAVLFHGRKANTENRKPTKIADVYGSRWLTALAGSVISLWGEPGDPVIEFRHLKQPMAEVGPFDLLIDRFGFIKREAGTDLLEVLRAAPLGLTSPAAAAVLYGSAPSRAQVEKARRKLAALEGHGLAFLRPGAASRTAGTYFATTPRGEP